MIGLILSLIIDAIDASPLDEMTLIGVPAVAIAEGAIIYYTTRSKTLAVIGIMESVVPVVDVIPFATIAWVIRHGKPIGIVLLLVFLAAIYLLRGWIGLPF